MAEEKEEKKEEKQSHPSEASLLEWIFAGVGLILVGGAIGFMIYRGATRKDTPPVIKVEVESVVPSGENFLVNVRVSNTGETTAAALIVEGELKNGEKSEETSELTLTYVPTQSDRRAGLLFKKNPKDYQLEVRAKGYELP